MKKINKPTSEVEELMQTWQYMQDEETKIPELDLNALVYDDEETIKEKQTTYAHDMAKYTETQMLRNKKIPRKTIIILSCLLTISMIFNIVFVIKSQSSPIVSQSDVIYVNINSQTYHTHYCSAVASMKAKNRKEISVEDFSTSKYSKYKLCGICTKYK